MCYVEVEDEGFAVVVEFALSVEGGEAAFSTAESSALHHFSHELTLGTA